MTISRRSSNFLLHAIALACIAAVAIALVSQYVFDMQPCAWCVLQRLIFLAIALACWLGIWGGRLCQCAPRVAAILVALLAAGGVTAAWYQYTVASNMFSCDMTFADRFIAGAGLDAAIPSLFGIYATCMDARVKLLGIEYALWGLGLFAAIAVVALVAALRRAR